MTQFSRPLFDGGDGDGRQCPKLAHVKRISACQSVRQSITMTIGEMQCCSNRSSLNIAFWFNSQRTVSVCCFFYSFFFTFFNKTSRFGVITSSDKTFNCFFSSPGMQSTFSQTPRLSNKNNARVGRLCVAFAWGTVRIRGQISATETEAQASAVLAVIVAAVTALLSVALLLLLSLLLFLSASHTHTETQQPELTTAFILGHFACCVRTLAIVRLTRRDRAWKPG